MVAYDGSNDANIAVDTAVDMMNKETDELILFTAIENVIQPWVFPMATGAVPMLIETQKSLEHDLKKKCAEKLKQCNSKLAKCSALCKQGQNAGDIICEAAKDLEIDHLVIGRNGDLGKFERFVMGSCSKYCVEHAPCNVVVAKINNLRDAEPIQPTDQQGVQQDAKKSN